MTDEQVAYRRHRRMEWLQRAFAVGMFLLIPAVIRARSIQTAQVFRREGDYWTITRRSRWVVGTLFALALVLRMLAPEVAWAGKLTCLTGTDPSVASDRAQITVVRSSVDTNCPCAGYDGSPGQAHGDYLKCAKGLIAAGVSSGGLRKQCKGTVTADYSHSTCGMPASKGEVPCIKRTAAGKVTCAVKPSAKCVDSPGKYTQVACANFTTCSGAADTNGDDLIGAADSGACACSPPFTDLYVATSGSLNGNGSSSNPYRRITDAVARARTRCETGGTISPEETMQIHVAPGTYIGSFNSTQLRSHPECEVLPIILNVPRLAVLGATVLVRDARGLPTGAEPESETILEPDQSLGQNQNLLLATGTADGGVGNGVTIDGFALDGGGEIRYPNLPVLVDRVSDFRISNNLIQHGSFGVTTRFASGTIEGNLLTHNAEAGAVATGGSIAQPATVFIHANRIAGNGQHGIMTLAQAELYPIDRGRNTLDLQPLQTTFDRNSAEDLQNIPDTLVVTLSDNDISNYEIFGIRLMAVIPEQPVGVCSGPLGYQTQDATQPLTAVLTANVLGNTFAGNGIWGVGMEAGFPCRTDPRPLLITFAGSFEGNSFVGHGRPAALFSFSEWGSDTPMEQLTRGLAKESTYGVTDRDGELAAFDYDNPLMDPVSGTVLNNTLILNGVEVPHGYSITP